MHIQLPYITAIMQGSAQQEYVYNSGGGYFIAPRSGLLQIECWGQGGNGYTFVPPSGYVLANNPGGAGGGAGGYSNKILNVSRSALFKWSIDSSKCLVSSAQYSLIMKVFKGGDGIGYRQPGTGGTASGGDTNFNGQSGFGTITSTGGAGGNCPNGGAGGAGGSPGNNGAPGATPGGGGGGHGGGIAPGAGGIGGLPQIRFRWL